MCGAHFPHDGARSSGELYSNRRAVRVHPRVGVCAVALLPSLCLFCQAARHYVILWCRNSPGISHWDALARALCFPINATHATKDRWHRSRRTCCWYTSVEMIISHSHVDGVEQSCERAERTRRITLALYILISPQESERERTAHSQPALVDILLWWHCVCVCVSEQAGLSRAAPSSSLSLSLWHPHTSTHTQTGQWHKTV